MIGCHGVWLTPIALASIFLQGLLAAGSDGTFTDPATGLMWQQGDGGEMTFEAAGPYCAQLTLAGRHDWRLPAAHESFSILDHRLRPPALDAGAFARTEAQYWWTSDRRADDASRVWVTNAGGGIGPHPKRETVSAGGEKRVHTRCVRGAAPAAASLKDNKDGSVTDGRTGLTWQQRSLPDGLTWDEAGKACAETWRLPNIHELQSINDERFVRPSVDHALFPDTAQEQYWSSTAMANRPERAWTVDFTFGIVSYDDKTEKLRVRCVRAK